MTTPNIIQASPAQVDFIAPSSGGMVAQGDLAKRLLQGTLTVEALRTQDILSKNDWIQFDNKVVEVARQRLVAVGDLISRGLSFNLPNAFGVTRLEWEKISDVGPAIVSMSGLSQGQSERVEFNLANLPIPIVHKDFQINSRLLATARNAGTPIDTTQAALASRVVSETIEQMLFLGSNVNGSSNKIYGYTTETNRNTGSTTADWNSATGDQIVGDVLAMIDKSVTDNMYGPWMLYCSNAAFVHLGDDYKAASDKTILQRIKEIPGISDVKPSANLGNGDAILVQMSSDVVDMIDGIQPTIVQWESNGGFMLNFKVMAIMVPRVRSDNATQSGIVHYS